MIVGLKTSTRFLEAKQWAIKDALEKLGIQAELRVDAFEPMPDEKQIFGFEELLQKAKKYAQETIANQDLGLSVGMENALSFIYSSNEWYYVTCVAVQTRSGSVATSFSSGISVPQWIIKEMQDKNANTFHSLIERLVGHPVDPVDFFSGYTLSRRELLLPPLLLTISQLSMEMKA